MNGHTDAQQFGPRDRIAAFAEATEVHVESLTDPCLANVYWGLSLGLRLALEILSAADPATRGTTQGRQPRDPAATWRPRRVDPVTPSASTRMVISPRAFAPQAR